MTPGFFILVLLASDPRPRLVSLQLQDLHQQALVETKAALADQPEEAKALGLNYLEGSLLQKLGRRREASASFAETMSETPMLAAHARFQLALAQEQLGHPEVAAGLVATLLGSSPPKSLLEPAMALLARTLRKGGDCRLLRSLAVRPFPAAERRVLDLARADCALEAGDADSANQLLVRLLEQNAADLTAWEAAQRLVALEAAGGNPRIDSLLGVTFHYHRDFDRSARYLEQVIADAATGARVEFETQYRALRSYFWRGEFERAASGYGELATNTSGAKEVAQAFYQQGRSYELVGNWARASEAYRRSYLAQPPGEWSGAALIAVLRIAWRRGHEQEALDIRSVLRQRRQWHSELARANLFLASSDLVRGRSDRAEAWLNEAERSSSGAAMESAYWRGRRAELDGDLEGAVESYLRLLRNDPHHPLSEAARDRLRAAPLSTAASDLGHRLSHSRRPDDLHAAWLLLGDEDEDGARSRSLLLQALLRDRSAAPYLTLSEVTIDQWPLWSARMTRPEEILLALGDFHAGATVVTRYFPLAVPNLAFTAAHELETVGETRRALWIAEVLHKRIPSKVPEDLLPVAYRRVLYPLSFRPQLERSARRHQIDVALLAAIIREESRFEPRATSAAAARGLTQFVLPTAERLASTLDLAPISLEDLEDPDVSIELGAAYLAELARRYGGKATHAVTAYNAGEAQVQLWQSYCFSFEPEEFFTKVSFRETRAYLTKVLRSRSQYRSLYGAELP